MKKYTKQDIMQLVEENDVQFIRLQFTDVFGALKMWRFRPVSWSGPWIINVCLTVLPSKDLCGLRSQICTCIRT